MRAELPATIALIAVSSCASAFPYRWYGIDVEGGRLLGPKPKDDLPISVCQPDEINKGKCAVMLIEEFDRLVSDYADKSERLKKCEPR